MFTMSSPFCRFTLPLVCFYCGSHIQHRNQQAILQDIGQVPTKNKDALLCFCWASFENIGNPHPTRGFSLRSLGAAEARSDSLGSRQRVARHLGQNGHVPCQVALNISLVKSLKWLRAHFQMGATFSSKKWFSFWLPFKTNQSGGYSYQTDRYLELIWTGSGFAALMQWHAPTPEEKISEATMG